MEPQKRKVISYIFNGKDLFRDWLSALKDAPAETAIIGRLDRVEEGNFGDHRFVGDGVWELRIHWGPGYRVYYGEDGPVIVLLLCGGDKKSQRKDIRLARRRWQHYRRLK